MIWLLESSRISKFFMPTTSILLILLWFSKMALALGIAPLNSKFDMPFSFRFSFSIRPSSFLLLFIAFSTIGPLMLYSSFGFVINEILMKLCDFLMKPLILLAR